MKFGRLIKEHAQPEWKRAYLDYRKLKKLIKTAAASNADAFANNGTDSSDDRDEEPTADEEEGHARSPYNSDKLSPLDSRQPDSPIVGTAETDIA